MPTCFFEFPPQAFQGLSKANANTHINPQNRSTKNQRKLTETYLASIETKKSNQIEETSCYMKLASERKW